MTFFCELHQCLCRDSTGCLACKSKAAAKLEEKHKMNKCPKHGCSLSLTTEGGFYCPECLFSESLVRPEGGFKPGNWTPIGPEIQAMIVESNKLHDPVPSPTGGLKADNNKPRYDLISPVALEEIAKVLSHGAQKYSPHNWRRGIEFSRLIRAALGHINKFNIGEDVDPESGLLHLAEAGCNIIFLLELCKTMPELDDRYKLLGQINPASGSLGVDVSGIKK